VAGAAGEGQPAGHFASLANQLTATRLALALPAAWLAGRRDARSQTWAAGLFFAGSLTDLLDGYVARRWGQVSPAGALLDPLADKLLVDGALAGLARRRAFPWPLLAVLLARDVAVTLLRGRRPEQLAPSTTARVKTALFYAGVWGLLRQRRRAARRAAWACVLAATALSLLSAAGYFRRAGAAG
jgi:CDP-diacylglycerol--glycerol-3-phosphate 3-phosphatidyltransferase